MNLNIQIIVILISFIFGVFYFLLFQIYKKYIRKDKLKIITDFIFNLIITSIFMFVLYIVNNLYLNYYMIIFFCIGFVISYLTVNHF